MNEHLRPVPESAAPTEPPASQGRAARRPRTSRALPTDRMKFEIQVGALRAIAIASDFGKTAVSSEDISSRLGVAATTAGLNNAFFMESGLVTRESKGRYKPTDAVNKFARAYGFDEAKAGELLAESLKSTWYFREIEQQLAMGGTPVQRMVEVLAHAAGATSDHSAQLTMLLTWLEYAGLVDTSSGFILVRGAPKLEEEDEESPAVKDHSKPPAGSSGEGSTHDASKADAPKDRSETILAFHFDLSLTPEDLHGLTPEQIHAVFDAVGKVMAIKATTT